MGLLQTDTGREHKSLGGKHDERYGPRFAAPDTAEEPGSRHEPQRLFERTLPVDPYAAWLEQREAEAEREREGRHQIRLVHRPRGGSGQGIAARRL